MIYTFGISYGNAPHFGTFIEFDIDLTEEQVSFLKDWLGKNGQCDYGYLESDNAELFEIINDACNDAILREYNRLLAEEGQNPVSFDEMDWPSITEFEWDQRLLG